MIFGAVLGAVGTCVDGGDAATGFAETGFLFLEGCVAGFHGEDMSEEVLWRSVFVEAADKVGDGGVEVLFLDDGGIEENGGALGVEGTGVFVGHAF